MVDALAVEMEFSAPLMDIRSIEDLMRSVGAETISVLLKLVPESIDVEIARIERCLHGGDGVGARRAVDDLRDFASNFGLYRLAQSATALSRVLSEGASSAVLAGGFAMVQSIAVATRAAIVEA